MVPVRPVGSIGTVQGTGAECYVDPVCGCGRCDPNVVEYELEVGEGDEPAVCDVEGREGVADDQFDGALADYGDVCGWSGGGYGVSGCVQGCGVFAVELST